MLIVVDTREKYPWTFDIWGCEITRKKLKAGDYAILGYESEFSIERKRNVGEIALNLGQQRKRFERELDILSLYNRADLICEFPLDYILQFPENSGIPKRYWKKLRISGNYLDKAIHELTDRYKINLVFCNNRMEAEEYAYNALKEYYDAIR